MVKPVEAALRLAYFRCLLLCNLFQTPGSLCKEYYLLIRNISSIYHIVAMRLIKHPGHTFGVFGSVFLEPGYDNILREEPNHSLSMLYSRKLIRLPNPDL
jgi:hypothetical protein